MASPIIVPKSEWLAKGGVEIQLEGGPNIIVYKSTIDSKLVVEVETDEGNELPHHDESGSPEVRIWLNEANLDIDSNVGTEYVQEDV